MDGLIDGWLDGLDTEIFSAVGLDLDLRFPSSLQEAAWLSRVQLTLFFRSSQGQGSSSACTRKVSEAEA